MSQDNISDGWVHLHETLADKNINILNVSISDGRTAIIVEYLYERPRDHKVIWPKTAFWGDDLADAMIEALDTINEIRGSEDK